MGLSWNIVNLCLNVFFSHQLCNALPINFETSIADSHTELLTGLVAVLLTLCSVVFLVGCLCCQRRNGFKVFNDGQVVATTASVADPGHVNPIANGEFTIFTPLSASHLNNNVFVSDQQVVSRLDGDYTYGDLNVSSWFGETEKDFPRSRLKYIRELGKGWFGRVVEGTAQDLDDERCWTPVAVRILDSTASSKDRVLFLHDAEIYKIDHPNILTLYGRCLDSVPLLLLQELCPQGDLKCYLLSNKAMSEQLLSSEYLLIWCCQMTSALKHLHEKKLTHPDLATRNCQLTSNLTLKLGDYGLSVSKYREDYYQGEPSIPVRWCAPESVTHTNTTIQLNIITAQANVWSLGVCFWEICECGKLPYAEFSDDDVVTKVLGSPGVRLSRPSCQMFYTDYIFRLMQLCWSTAETRPSLSQVYLTLTDLLQVFKNTEISDKGAYSSAESFDIRWQSLKPNTIVKTDNYVIEMPPIPGEMTEIKTLSPSLTNLHGSLDNLDKIGEEKSMESWLENVHGTSDTKNISQATILNDVILQQSTSSNKSSPDVINSKQKIHFKLGPLNKPFSPSVESSNQSDSLNDSMIFTQRSSGSETEEENWKSKIERGAYSEKVRQKSKSVTDLMVLTHIDCSESDTETPLPSLDYRFNYKNVRYAPKQNLESLGYMHGSEGNLLSIQDNFQEELKKLQVERKDSLTFVPDDSRNSSLEISASPSKVNFNLTDSPSKKLLQELNSTAELKPANQVFNVFNVSVNTISPIHIRKLSTIINLDDEKTEGIERSSFNVPMLREIVRNHPNLIQINNKPERNDSNCIHRNHDVKIKEENCQIEPKDEVKVITDVNQNERMLIDCEEVQLNDNKMENQLSINSNLGENVKETHVALNNCCNILFPSTEENLESGHEENFEKCETETLKEESSKVDKCIESNIIVNSLNHLRNEFCDINTKEIIDKTTKTDGDKENSFNDFGNCNVSEDGFSSSDSLNVLNPKNTTALGEEDNTLPNRNIELRLENYSDCNETNMSGLEDLAGGLHQEYGNREGQDLIIQQKTKPNVSFQNCIVPHIVEKEKNGLPHNSLNITEKEFFEIQKDTSTNTDTNFENGTVFERHTETMIDKCNGFDLFSSNLETQNLFSNDLNEDSSKTNDSCKQNKEIVEASEDINKKIHVDEASVNQALEKDISSTVNEFDGNDKNRDSIQSVDQQTSLGSIRQNSKSGDKTVTLKTNFDYVNSFIFQEQNNSFTPDGSFQNYNIIENAEPSNNISIREVQKIVDNEKRDSSKDLKANKTKCQQKLYQVPRLIDIIEYNDELMDYIIAHYEPELSDDLSPDSNSVNIKINKEKNDDKGLSVTSSIQILQNELNQNNIATISSSKKNSERETLSPKLNFDLSEDQDASMPNSLTHFNIFSSSNGINSLKDSLKAGCTSTPEKNDFESLNMYVATPDLDLEGIKPDLNYSLETWDNFLGNAFDQNQGGDSYMFSDNFNSSEPHSSIVAEHNSLETETDRDLDDLNKTFTVETALDATFTVDEDNVAKCLGDDTSGEKWKTGGGWFLHPQFNSEDLSGDKVHSQSNSSDSYVGFSMDDEIMAAIRNELMIKLPQAQGASTENIKEDEEWESTDKNEVFLRYNVYNTPLSPIPEEVERGEEDDEGELYPYIADSDDEEDSDWSKQEDEEETPPLESPIRHLYHLSQDSCCSNDTLFNLEELAGHDAEKEFVIEKVETDSRVGHITSNACESEDETIKLELPVINIKEVTTNRGNLVENLNQEHEVTKFSNKIKMNDNIKDTAYLTEFLNKEKEHSGSLKNLENTNSDESNSETPSNLLPFINKQVAPLPSPDDKPWKQLPVAQLTLNVLVGQGSVEPQNVDLSATEEGNEQTDLYTTFTEHEYDDVSNEQDLFNEVDYVNITNLENSKINAEYIIKNSSQDEGAKSPDYVNKFLESSNWIIPNESPDDDDADNSDMFGVLADIRFSGPGDSQLMTTSFSESNELNDEQDWDSGSDTRSSSSGEFIWKEGEHEESLKALQAAPQDVLDDIRPMEGIQEESSSEESSGSDEDEECPEFVPSAWDKYAIPAKSALRSPEKIVEKHNKKTRGVSFKKQKYHCVYEYPRELESPVSQGFDSWRDPTSLYSPYADTLDSNDEFYVSGSASPFDMVDGLSSQFFPGCLGSKWTDLAKFSDNTTPDSGVEDVTPGSLIEDYPFVTNSNQNQIQSLKVLCQNVLAKDRHNKSKAIEALGGLRHTRDKLKLDLPPSPSAFTNLKTFNLEPYTEPLPVRENTSFTTFGKSRFSVQHVDTPEGDSEENRNVCFDVIPYKPLAKHLLKDSSNDVKNAIRVEKGEASLLDSADEDSGIESSTLERKLSETKEKLVTEL